MSKSLLETICCQEGLALHLDYHQTRLEQALQTLGSKKRYRLSELVEVPSSDLLRCRFLYSDSGFEVSYIPYTKRPITSLQLLEAPDLEYDLKYANRDALNALFEERMGADDILITQEGHVKDTSIANIAFFDGEKWITPEVPLLKGTTRARLLKEKKIFCAPIKVDALSHFKGFALMNAMIGFDIINNGIIRDQKIRKEG